MSYFLPVQPLSCRNDDCGLPQGGRCARASTIENPLRDCSDLVREPDEASEADDELSSEAEGNFPDVEDDSEPAPWSGRHLRLADALRLMGTSPCRVITVVGPYDAGKTCLLTSFFLQIANGGTKPNFPYAFAGSSSLHGFLTLAKQASRYQGEPDGQVVDHTTFDDPEDAGAFLHLALRPRKDVDDRVIDLLLSDIPGEWFDDYATEEDEKVGRRLPFLSRCDGFIVLADSSALLAKGGAGIDQRTSHVLRRLSKNMAEWGSVAPVVFVLSKYDCVWSRIGDPPQPEAALDPANWGILRPRLGRSLTALRDMKAQGVTVRVMAVSAVPRPLDQGQPIGVVEPFAWMFEQIDRRRHHARLRLSIPEHARPFTTMRREELP